jgi:hypothetical protein
MTNPLIRLVFGVQILDEKTTRLVVSGALGLSPMPPLTGVRRSDSATFSESCSSNTWTVDLDQGDYIVRIEASSWTEAVLTIEAQLDTGQLAPRFVYWGNLPESNTEGLAGWIETSATVDPPDTSTIGNPKDPCPPPPPPNKRSSVSPSAAVTWFSNTLDPLWDQASTDQRGGAPGTGGPPPPRHR